MGIEVVSSTSGSRSSSSRSSTDNTGGPVCTVESERNRSWSPAIALSDGGDAPRPGQGQQRSRDQPAEARAEDAEVVLGNQTRSRTGGTALRDGGRPANHPQGGDAGRAT